MPDTPMSESAARTSSSLKGLMIAVTSFMGGHSICGPAARGDFAVSMPRRRIAVIPRAAPFGIRSSPHRLHHGGAGRIAALHPGAVGPSLLGYSLAMYERIVIAGGGQAAVQAVDTLRRRGFTGQLTLVGEEPWP